MTQNINKSISSIFEKGPDKNYTDDARLYQDILEYCFTVNPRIGDSIAGTFRFILRDLQKWLIQHNLEFREEYQGSHTSLNNKIHAKEGRINNKFETLIDLSMIERSKPPTSLQTSLYVAEKTNFEYTKSGILLALIIKSMSLEHLVSSERKDYNDKYSEELEKIYSSIYDILESLLMKRDSPSYTNIFFSFFLRKCKDKGLFRKLIQQLQNILNTDDNIIRIQDLLVYILKLNYPDASIRMKFFDLWTQTIAELKPEAKHIVLYQLKLNNECRFQTMKEPLPKLYEEIRFEYRNDFEHFIVDGKCERCGQYDVIPIHYVEYGRLVAAVSNDDTILKRVECKKCRSKDSMIITKF